MSNEALFAALEQAVPGFSATEITVPAVDERQGEYKCSGIVNLAT